MTTNEMKYYIASLLYKAQEEVTKADAYCEVGIKNYEEYGFWQGALYVDKFGGTTAIFNLDMTAGEITHNGNTVIDLGKAIEEAVNETIEQFNSRSEVIDELINSQY